MSKIYACIWSNDKASEMAKSWRTCVLMNTSSPSEEFRFKRQIVRKTKLQAIYRG